MSQRKVISYIPDGDPPQDEVDTILQRLGDYEVETIGLGTIIVDAPIHVAEAAIIERPYIKGYADWRVRVEGRLQINSSRAVKVEDLTDEQIYAIAAARHPVFTDIENLRTLFEVMADKIGPENARISLERLARIEAALRENFDYT